LSKTERIVPVLAAYISILLGGFLVAHWWWSALHPFIEASLPQFFLSHLLLVFGIWFLLKRIQHGRKVAMICGSFFIIYGFSMAVLLIPGGLEEIGDFTFIIPVFLVALGVVLGVSSFFNSKRAQNPYTSTLHAQ
jgi:fumarate reductase subunit D